MTNETSTFGGSCSQPFTTSIADLIDDIRTRQILRTHPFLVRLASTDPVNISHIHCLLANLREAVSKNFTRWLASLVPRVDDDAIRCVLAMQLNDELGRGDPANAHSKLFDRMMTILHPQRLRGLTDEQLLEPGRRGAQALGAIYGATDAYVAVGGVIVGEVLAEQLDGSLADQFRRQSHIQLSDLEWLVLHENLEKEHSESSTQLVNLIPSCYQAAVFEGGMAAVHAGWRFLSDLDGLCDRNLASWSATREAPQ